MRAASASPFLALCAIALGGLLASVAAGCGASEPRVGEPGADGQVAVDPGGADDPRYRLRVELSGADGPGSDRLVRLRVEPRGGWHLAPEADARLSLDSPGGPELDPPAQRGDSALAFDADALEFAVALRGEPPPGARATGRLKFGICEDRDTTCAIVERDLALPLTAAVRE